MRSTRPERYVLVSACRNEGAYIEGLIDSIDAQTIKPAHWIIVDDGSTDDTYTRAMKRSERLPYIRVVQMPQGRPRSFTSQVFAAQHGCDLVRGVDYDFIGFLDADIRVAPHYYQRLLDFFEADRGLGLCGGEVIDQYPDRIVHSRRGSEEFHVPGGVQFFRRECFEQIGGFVPIEGGGQDTIADVMSMMCGWKIRVFPELQALHLRPDGVGAGHVLRRGMAWGRKFYLVGYHPLFYLGQCVRRASRQPILIGSVCQLIGFVCATWRSEPRPVSEEFVRFLRRTQLARLREAVRLPHKQAEQQTT
jgi:glycosyltransferase involved in cell wall biosynthesis